MALPRIDKLLVLFLLIIASVAAAAPSKKTCAVQSLYQIGDSISDVGNLVIMAPKSSCGNVPYGQSFGGRPTGRCSDGLLMVDQIASRLQLPRLEPYLNPHSNTDHGVNFAVSGSTALDSSFFSNRRLHVSLTNSPLNTQLKWFNDHLRHVCHTEAQCAKRLEHALVFVGEIGGNDYNAGFFQNRSIAEIRTYVSSVVGAITNAVKEVIHAGAGQIVVPGNFPVGCFPIYLSAFPNPDPKAYDDMKCLKNFNRFAQFHNKHLKEALDKLRKEYPNVVILYGDYYAAFQSVLRRASSLGFDESSTLKACCGTGGAYNFNITKQCGAPDVPVCSSPAQSISWDGIHLTQETYKHMAEWLLDDLLPKMQCTYR